MSRAAGVAAALAPALLLALSACPAPAARKTLRPPPAASREAEPSAGGPPGRGRVEERGVVHVVRRGETLWRIARTYGVEPAALMAANGLSDPRTVGVGAELLVPGAGRVLEVPPPGAPVPLAAATAGGSPVLPPPPDPASPAESPRDGPRRETPAPASAHGVPAPAPLPARSSAAASSRARLAWPLKGVLYGRYGLRSGQRHDGIDLAAPEGTTVGAAADGKVIFAGVQAGYGALVILRHEGDLVTLYAHNARVLVRQGERVRQGQPIATVGQTGKTTGPHLHFEVREGTRPRDPLRFLP